MDDYSEASLRGMALQAATLALTAPQDRANVRPCHSIHCRHYDLADGKMCEVEYQRLQERIKRAQALRMIAEAYTDHADLIAALRAS